MCVRERVSVCVFAGNVGKWHEGSLVIIIVNIAQKEQASAKMRA